MTGAPAGGREHTTKVPARSRVTADSLGLRLGVLEAPPAHPRNRGARAGLARAVRATFSSGLSKDAHVEPAEHFPYVGHLHLRPAIGVPAEL